MHLPSLPVSGERAVSVHPRPRADAESAGFAQRLRFFPGRTLTGDGLARESRYREATLAIAATSFAPGIVSGLDLALRETRTRSGSVGAAASDWFVQVSPGIGLGAHGDDVVLTRPLSAALDDIPTLSDAPVATTSASATPVPPRGLGVLILQPISYLTDSARADASLMASDPADDAFADRRIVEGCRLVFMPWPNGFLRPPARGPRFRNLLAELVFADAADRAYRGTTAPWDDLGVPLAVLDVARDGNVQFADRHLIARAGGGPRPTPLLPGQGHPALWQARMRQFADHLADLAAAGLSPKDAEARFAFLPPFANLPSGLFRFDATGLRTDFLPPTCRVQAVPLPMEQLELLLESVASLAPLDLDRGDDLTVYVPVPQRDYDPRLLHTDRIDPAFAAALNEAFTRVAEHKRRRDVLTAQAPRVIGALDRASVLPPHTGDDPAALPSEPAAAASITPAETAFDAQAVDRLVRLHTDLIAIDSSLIPEIDLRLPRSSVPGDWSPDLTGFAGLRPWIRDLEDRIRAANDKVDYGFLRAQSDIYKVRQLMLGNVQATRLATSPALAGIAKGESASANQLQLATYFKAATAPRQVTNLMLLKAAPSAGAGANAPDPASAASEPAPQFLKTAIRRDLPTVTLRQMQKVSPQIPRSVGFAPAIAPAVANLTVAFAPFAVSSDITGQRPLIGKLPALRTTTIAERLADPPAPEAKNAAVASRLALIAELLRLHAPVPLDGGRSHPGISLIGVEIPLAGHHVGVVDKGWVDKARLEAPVKREAVGKLIEDLDKELARTDLPTATRALKEVQRGDAVLRRDALDQAQPFLASRVLASSRPTATRAALQFTRDASAQRRALGLAFPDYASAQRSSVALLDADLMSELSEAIYDPDPDDGDESDYYSAAVTAQELATAALRAVEARIDLYERALDLLRGAESDLADIASAYGARVAAIGALLGEARHDAGVALALRDEEQARIDALNARRGRVLGEVAHVVLARARSVAAVDDLDVAPCDRVWSDPLPEALAAGSGDLPDEIEQAIALWRRAPLAWLPRLRQLAEHLARPEVVHAVLAEAKVKAHARVQQRSSAPNLSFLGIGIAQAASAATAASAANTSSAVRSASSAGAGPLALGSLQRIFAGWAELSHRTAVATAALDLSLTQTQGFREAIRVGVEHLSLDDLASSGRGTPKLAAKASAELARIAGVAATLHRYAAQIPAGARIAIAEAISVFDRVVDLRDLTRLPGFARLDKELRRDLQRLVSFLFSEVDAQRPEAVQLATDLVRVAILLACHAPVSALLTARLLRPTTARTGDHLPIAIDSGRARIGQSLRLFQGTTPIAHAVIADLAGATAHIRLVSTTQLALTLTPQVRIVS